MPRTARIVVPGYPHHITQRGNNRNSVFFDDDDRNMYLRLLAGYAEKHSLEVWSYCLMNNHVHLLVVPKSEHSLASGIGLTHQVYTQYLNHKMNQTGRVWQNRFFSCVVESQEYLWSVARYIERNPLPAGMAASAESYPWSSARANMKGASDMLINSSNWLDIMERSAYRDFVASGNNCLDDEKIRKATRTGRPYGSADFIGELERQFNRCFKEKRRGRPQKKMGSVPNLKHSN